MEFNEWSNNNDNKDCNITREGWKSSLERFPNQILSQSISIENHILKRHPINLILDLMSLDF